MCVALISIKQRNTQSHFLTHFSIKPQICPTGASTEEDVTDDGGEGKKTHFKASKTHHRRIKRALARRGAAQLMMCDVTELLDTGER